MCGVYQEAIYNINHTFDTDLEVEAVNEFLNHNQPVCTEVDWFGKELNISNFDSEYFAKSFYKQLLVYVDTYQST